MSQPILEVNNLAKEYGTYRAVSEVSFEIARGQVMGLLGPNGAGKSTTIQMLLGITLPTSGQIRYFGKDLARNREACLQRVNFASAYNTLQGRISVRDNLLVFAGLYNVRHPDRKIDELMEYFEIGRLARQRYWDLSAGERTRVNLAKALLNDPELVLMDEPTASLDPDIADKTLSLIEDLRRDRGLSILFTSHNMSEVDRVCDEVIFLDHGRVVSRDTPHNHKKRLTGVKLRLRYQGTKADFDQALAGSKLAGREEDIRFESDQWVMLSTTHEQVADLVILVRKAGVEIVDVDVVKPTLEDVFMDIARGGTGRG